MHPKKSGSLSDIPTEMAEADNSGNIRGNKISNTMHTNNNMHTVKSKANPSATPIYS